MRVVRRSFPGLNGWLGDLPDPRSQEMCLYLAAHIWWHVLATYLFRTGSRNAFDEFRNSHAAPWNMGLLCGQTAQDPRFAGHPTVTCSDNAKRHASRVDPDQVRQIPLRMIKALLKRRMFDGCRLFDHWYTVIVDGTVQEKCRQGFRGDGKSSSGQGRYRYVLQAVILGPQGNVFPFLHEFVDMHNPVTEKEDCELKAFLRLSRRLKELFPRLPLCWVGDALYACEPVLRVCREYGWRYILTLKEGRQPTTWEEMLQLLPRSRANVVRTDSGPVGARTRMDCRWVEQVMLGKLETNVILAGEITPQSATLYGYITDLPHLAPQRVMAIAATGRQRHRIEDKFNAEKNHRIGLEHVFCAETTAAKNFYTMMQAAQILWALVSQGYCKRVYAWAKEATDQGLALAAWQGWQFCRWPPDLPPLGQIRFGFS